MASDDGENSRLMFSCFCSLYLFVSIFHGVVSVSFSSSIVVRVCGVFLVLLSTSLLFLPSSP